MADDNIFTRIGKAFSGGGASDPAPESIDKRAAIPTGTIGTSHLGVGEGAELVWVDREANVIGPRRWDTYAEMIRNVGIIAAGLRLFLNLIANAVWAVNPPEDDKGEPLPGAQDIADQAYEILFGMTSSWASVVKKMAMYRALGFSLMEWTAVKRADGAIGLLDIEHRPQRTIVRWQRDETGTVTGAWQRVTGRSEVMIPRAKLVYCVDDTFTDHPEGLGLLRHLAVTSRRLKDFRDLQETAFETDLRGIPVARAPLAELRKEVTDAGAEGSPERAKAEARRLKILAPMYDWIDKHVRSKQTGVLLASDTFISQGTDNRTPSAIKKWDLELLTGDSQAFDEIANSIKEMTEDMARVLGVEHLLLGTDGAGSLALARSKVGTFYMTVTSTCQDLVEIIDRDIIGPLAEMNGWPDELRPEMSVNEISDRDIAEVMDALAQLAQAGAPVMPNDPAVGEIFDLLGLTRPPERSDAELNMSLNPGRNDPANPDKPIEGNPEKVKKRRVIKSRRARPRRR